MTTRQVATLWSEWARSAEALLHVLARQEQALTTEQGLEESVVTALTIGGVADDGVRNVFQMPAQLVTSSAFRAQCDEGIAAAGVAIDGVRQLNRGQPAKMGEGGLGGFGSGHDGGVVVAGLVLVVIDVALAVIAQLLAPARAASAATLDGIELAHERMVNGAALSGVAAYDGQVAFVHRA